MKSRYIIALAALFGFTTLQAQTAVKDSVSMSRELTLEREYNPTIGNAVKLHQLPQLHEPTAVGSKIAFSNYTSPYTLQPSLQYLSAQSFKDALDVSTNRGWAVLGISTLVDINADLGYQALNNKKTFLDFFLSHRSSNNKVKYVDSDEKQKMKFNDTWLGANLSHDFSAIQLDARIKYTNSGFNYYGETYIVDAGSWLPAPLPDKDKKQSNNLFETFVGLSRQDAETINASLNLGYTYFSQKYGETLDDDGRGENRFLLGLNLNKELRDDQVLGVNLKMNNYSYSNAPEYYEDTDWESDNYTALLLNPYFGLEGSDWKLNLGVNVSLFKGTGRFGPDISFRYMPSNHFAFFAKAAGGTLTDNSSYNMFYINRYVHPDLRVKDTENRLDLLAGVDILPVDNLKFTFFGGFEMLSDAYFFSYIPVYSHVYYGHAITTEYADANLFKLGGRMQYDYQKQFFVDLDMTYNKWSDRGDAYDGIDFVPWGKPSFIANLGLGYQFSELPLRLDAKYHLEANRKLDWRDEDKSYSINDLSVTGNYLINKNVSVFATANNLLFQKQNLWFGYPAQNFSLMLGVSAKF